VQVFPVWTPPRGVLGELVTAASVRAASLRARRSALERAAAAAPPPPGFAAALRGVVVAIIAEVKRRSPSRGDINVGLRVDEQVAAYVEGGASALSVLTEPERFGGTPEDLAAAAARVAVPVLRKDFVVDALQIVEARVLGAAAVLLIVRALDREQLPSLVEAARAFGLEPLVEVRDEGELERALAAGARVVGVNSRDLETLVVDSATIARVIPLIPPDVLAVAESGIGSPADVVAASAVGADAVLVGSFLSAAGDPAAAVRALAAVPRIGRRR
jgi:indole-3-glycerol phosphate synthase